MAIVPALSSWSSSLAIFPSNREPAGKATASSCTGPVTSDMSLPSSLEWSAERRSARTSRQSG
jgi:hypothetical protein